jgi:sugar (pentulose or hexulose) kinase
VAASVWWQAIVEAIAQAVAEAGRPATDYLGITVTSLRQGFVLLGERGEPLAPGVLNFDRRGAARLPSLSSKRRCPSRNSIT